MELGELSAPRAPMRSRLGARDWGRDLRQVQYSACMVDASKCCMRLTCNERLSEDNEVLKVAEQSHGYYC